MPDKSGQGSTGGKRSGRRRVGTKQARDGIEQEWKVERDQDVSEDVIGRASVKVVGSEEAGSGGIPVAAMSDGRGAQGVRVRPSDGDFGVHNASLARRSGR